MSFIVSGTFDMAVAGKVVNDVTPSVVFVMYSGIVVSERDDNGPCVVFVVLDSSVCVDDVDSYALVVERSAVEMKIKIYMSIRFFTNTLPVVWTI